MKNKYIYILSNPSFKNNILKIGFTSCPHRRTKELSNSTATPTAFKLEYFTEIDNSKTIETRTHLLLDHFRINPNKEYFKIPLDDAIKAINLAKTYTTIHSGTSETFGLRNDFLNRIEQPPLNTSGLKILYMMIANTPSNTRFDILEGTHEIKDCFISTLDISGIWNKTLTQTNNNLRNFCNKYSDLKILIGESKCNVTVFSTLKYSKGQCLWSFTPEFRKFFINEKITHLK